MGKQLTPFEQAVADLVNLLLALLVFVFGIFGDIINDLLP